MSATGSRTVQGFTLLELLVVLTIMLSLTFALPMARDRLQPSRQVGIYAQQLAANLRSLRSEATATGRVADLTIGSSEHTYVLSGDAKAHPLPETMTLQVLGPEQSADAGQSPAIRFFPDGSSSGGTVRVTRPGYQVSVVVSALTGRVSVE